MGKTPANIQMWLTIKHFHVYRWTIVGKYMHDTSKNVHTTNEINYSITAIGKHYKPASCITSYAYIGDINLLQP